MPHAVAESACPPLEASTACGGRAEIAGSPFDPSASLVRAFVSPWHPEAFTTAELVFFVALLVGVLVLACYAFRKIGVTPFETCALLVAAPLVANVEHAFWQPTPSATLAFNAAGFLIPAIVSLKMILEGRAPFFAALLVLAAGTVASYYSSYAVPNEGVLLYYRIPALVAGALAVLLARGRREAVGPLAYVSGAGGVIIGADALHLHELLVSDDPHRIVIGGAGILDGIFLVGLLAIILAALGHSAVRSLRLALGGEPVEEPAPPPPRDPPTRGVPRDVGGLG